MLCICHTGLAYNPGVVCSANVLPWTDISSRVFILHRWAFVVAESVLSCDLTSHVCSGLCVFCFISDPGVSDL